MPPHLHPKNAETRLRAVEGDPFHQAGQGFAIMGGTVGDRVIHDAQSSTVDTAMPVDASGGARHGGGRTEKNGPGYTGIFRDNWDAAAVPRPDPPSPLPRAGATGTSQPGPRNPARETIACSPAATSLRACLASPAPRPRPLKAPEIHGKTRGCPKAIPEREHRRDWVARGQSRGKPVSPRFWASARRLLNPRQRPLGPKDRTGIRLRTRESASRFIPVNPAIFFSE